MSNQILFCNTGWMEEYEGITETDKIIGGGKYVEANNDGGEVYNFHNRAGFCYGYVQPVNPKSSNSVSGGVIKIEKLGASEDAKSISNIDIILTAKRPTAGTVIVGWYKNATVYREKQEFDKSKHHDTEGRQYGYRFYAEKSNVTLLKPDERVVEIPRATGKRPVKGGMGQSNVWYAQKLEDGGVFLSEVSALLNHGNIYKNKSRSSHKTDADKNKLVETIAIELVTEHFNSYGYIVNSVEGDNLGWDLNAISGDIELKLEVKGLSGLNVNAQLTSNEYTAMLSSVNQFTYRVCVVTNCLGKEPKLNVFSFNLPSNSWVNQNGEILKIQEKLAAILTI